MEDRDRLSAVCFRAVALLNHQETLISRLRNAFDSLSRFSANGGESSDSLAKEFHALGLNLSTVIAGIRPRVHSNESPIPGNLEASEVLRVVGDLDASDRELVTAFVMQQVSKQRQLHEEIEDEKHKRRSLQSKYSALVSMLIPTGNAGGARDFIMEITRLKKAFVSLQQTTGVVRAIVGTFEAFASRFPDNPDIERCLVRIRSWLQSDNSEVDVAQEIDFILGLCLQNREGSSEASSATSEVAFGRNQQTLMSHFDAEMLKQIRDLKQTVCDMKEQLRASEDERRTFITKNFRRQLPVNARWLQICEYLLNMRRR
jgi:hypothetical protein